MVNQSPVWFCRVCCGVDLVSRGCRCCRRLPWGPRRVLRGWKPWQAKTRVGKTGMQSLVQESDPTVTRYCWGVYIIINITFLCCLYHTLIHLNTTLVINNLDLYTTSSEHSWISPQQLMSSNVPHELAQRSLGTRTSPPRPL